VARTYIGTPYHHQGRVKGKGIDCIGLGVCIAHEFGWPHEDLRTYSRRPDGKLLVRLHQQMDALPIEAMDEPGVLLCMSYDKPWVPQHTAIRSDYGIIHAQWLGRHSPNRVCEHVFSPVWRERVMAAFRFRQS